MCLIVFTPNIRRATIRKSVLERGFTRNSDGAGFAYLANGRVVVSKGYDDFAAFWRAYRPIAAMARGPVLIHFRWSTIGSENLTNTQPSVITPDRLVMAHNGTFDGLKAVADKHDLSDSVALAQLLGRLNWAFPFTRPQADMLRALCDDSSKLVFMSSTGRHLIINESEGKWSRGAWYSDGGDVLEPTPKTWAYKPYTGNYSPPDDTPYDRDDPDSPDYEDFDIGNDPKKGSKKMGRLKVRQKPTMGGRPSLGIGLDQRMSLFAAEHGYKHFSLIDSDILDGRDYQTWHNMRSALLQETASLTS